MSCDNCDDTGTVALMNARRQIYEFRKCPICTCQRCSGTGIELLRNHVGDELAGTERRCEACRPDRFDAHVRLHRKLFDPRSPFNILRKPDPSPERLLHNAKQLEKLYGKHGSRWALLRKLLGIK